MAVDLSDLVDLLRSEVDVPGTDSFPLAVEDDWINQLSSGFWETVLDGITTGYTELEGIVTPITGTTDLSRELQQLVIMYAGVRVIRNKIMNLNSVFKAKAGPVEFQVEHSATVLRGVLDELVRRRNLILRRLSDVGVTQSYYIDAVLARTESLRLGDTTWVDYGGGGSSTSYDNVW